MATVALATSCGEDSGAAPDEGQVDGQAVLDAFTDAGLAVPNARDNTARMCAPEGDLECEQWITTDILAVVVWTSPEAAQHYLDSAILPAEAVDETTTVGFQEGGTTPAYDRASYEAVLDTLS